MNRMATPNLSLVAKADSVFTGKQLRARELLKVARTLVESAVEHTTPKRTAVSTVRTQYILTDTAFLRLKGVLEDMEGD